MTDSYKPQIEKWPVIARRSHSFTCHSLTNHTCLYSPAAGYHRPLAGTHCAYPRKDGQAEFTWVAGIGFLHREFNPDTVTHPSTNRARRRLTLLIETNALTTMPKRHTERNIHSDTERDIDRQMRQHDSDTYASVSVVLVHSGVVPVVPLRSCTRCECHRTSCVASQTPTAATSALHGASEYR